MGLTIKEQCIPDVTEPMEGFSETRSCGLPPRRCGEGLRAGGGARSAAGGGGEAQALQAYRPPGQGGPQLALGDVNIPLPGWHVGRGVRLPAAMSPASMPSRLLLPGWEGGWMSLARARVSVSVSSMCILHKTAGGGAREVHVSLSAGLSSALMCTWLGYFKKRVRLERCQSGLAVRVGVTRETSPRRARI